MKKLLALFGLILGLLLCLTASHAENKYLLCGSDEDGCYHYPSCACIPYNKAEIGQAFCLNLSKMICEPFVENQSCDRKLQNKAECLALLFQSTSHAPCKEVFEDFCLENHIAICNEKGDFGSCGA